MTTSYRRHGLPYPDDAPASQALFDRAQAIVPGGVNSPVRAFRAVGGTPRFMVRGAGPWLFDADGRRYVDLVCSWGPLIHGHAHPEIVEAVQAGGRARHQLRHPHRRARSSWPRRSSRRTPVEQVRLVNSGTEATMTAIRLARGFTGRSQDREVRRLLPRSRRRAAGRGRLRRRHPGPARLAGVTGAAAGETIVLPYNDVAAVEAVFAAQGADIAAIITEAAPGNMGVVAPRDGFNQRLAEIAHAHGALLIVDEVMTGFRVSRGRLGRARSGRRRPVHVRQGHGRWAARRGLRRAHRDHVPARPGRPGLPGRHALR